MTDYRLIGSRSSKILQRKEKCDHDYVGLESSLYKIIEKFGTLTFCKKTIYPFLKENYEDALKDIKQWKHLDSSFGLEYLEKIKKVEGIFKYELKTKDDLIEYEIVNPLLSNSLILECKEEDDNLLEAIKTSHIIFPVTFLSILKIFMTFAKFLSLKRDAKS
jgi:hypothetical protein